MATDSKAGAYDCSGLTIISEVPLSAPSSVREANSSQDIELTFGKEMKHVFERPSADVVAELVVDDYLCYTFCRVGDYYVGRLPWVADFVIDSDLRRVVCHPVESGLAQMIPIIVPGTLTAFLLSIGGECVLHGSAVDLGGRALAFVGVSGQGKSTMAAIFCAGGAKLVSDDVLPIEFDQSTASPANSVFCRPSGREIRLREKAASLALRFDQASVRKTQDERHAVAPVASESRSLPLSAIILPRPDDHALEVTARKLGVGEASLALGRCERIEGWRGTDHLRQHFKDAARIVESVPVFEVTLPWGPPFGVGLAQQVLDACDLDYAMTSEAPADHL
jgi:hypothetical protein